MKWVVGLSSGLVQAKFFFGKRGTSDIFHTVGRGCSRYKAFRIWMIGNAKKSENSFRIQFVISSAMINKKCLSKQGLGIKVVITLIAWAKGVDKTRNTEHSGACRNVLCSEFYLIELTDSVNRNFWFPHHVAVFPTGIPNAKIGVSFLFETRVSCLRGCSIFGVQMGTICANFAPFSFNRFENRFD